MLASRVSASFSQLFRLRNKNWFLLEHTKHLLPQFMALPMKFSERKSKKNNNNFFFGKHSMKRLIGFQLKTEIKSLKHEQISLYYVISSSTPTAEKIFQLT